MCPLVFITFSCIAFILKVHESIVRTLNVELRPHVIRKARESQLSVSP